MGDQDHRPARTSDRINPVRHSPQRIDVQSGVGLIQDRQFRVEYGHLEDLVPFLLPAREAFVERAIQEALIQLDELHFFLDEVEKVDGIQLFETTMLSYGIHSRLQEVTGAHSGDLDRVLEGQKDPLTGALFGGHPEQVFPLVQHLTGCDLIAVPTGQYVGQCTFTGAVWTHDGVNLAVPHHQIHPAQDLYAPYLHVQIFNYEQYMSFKRSALSDQPSARTSTLSAES